MKRVIAVITAFLTAVTVLPNEKFFTAKAAGTSSEGLKSCIRTDTDSKKFTHKEWTGTSYTDLSGKKQNAEDVFGINREEAAVTIIPFQDDKTACDAVNDYDKREESSYLQLLTGKDQIWSLNVVNNRSEADKYFSAGFTSESFVPDGSFKEVTLPESWTCQGFDYPIYTNISVPFQSKYDSFVQAPAAPVNYNPVGLYIKKFTPCEDIFNSQRRTYIQFDGVESSYYVYLNGKEVGYSEDTFSPHKFDITDYLKDGENTLCVEVHKFCDGTWFEDQDMIYDGGIFRDVFLTSEPLVKINDYTVVTDLDSDYKNAVLKVSGEIKNDSTSDMSGWSLKIKAFDENGVNIIPDSAVSDIAVTSGKSSTFSTEITVFSPKLWSAETPNIYALVLTLEDGNSKEVETVSAQLGFREIGFTPTQVDGSFKVTTSRWDPVTINGERLLIKGVNRHDTDPVHGKAVPKETMLEDVRMMKQYNINAIRTSHYSNDSYLYWLCGKYGMYMMAETNMESHALMSDNDAKGLFYELGMDRTNTTFERLKNYPAIFSWSVGNEMVYTGDPGASNGLFRDMIWYFKKNDPTRPVHSEGQGDSMGVDISSQMYPSQDGIRYKAGNGKIPYIMCEYVHAMGNSVGGMKEYWDVIRSADNMMGGFVWDWADQSRLVSIDNGGSEWTFTDSKGNSGKCTGSDSGFITDTPDKTFNGGKAFTGYSVISNSSKINSSLSGTGKSFTFEAVVKPNSADINNVIIAKGDTQAALKTKSSGSGLEFFVYDSEWKAVSCDFPSGWEGKWHQVAGVYDRGSISIYVDGVLMNETSVSDSIAGGSQPVGIGIDTETGRKFDGAISVARIYSKALSASEIKGQMSSSPKITASDSSVLVWLDYSDITLEESGPWDYYSLEDAHKNLYSEETKGHYMAYGGDWGDVPNDNSFCQNGIVSPDRDPQPEINEVKYQYQNFWFSSDETSIQSKTVKVYNESQFKNLSDYDVSFKLLKNGEICDEGAVDAVSVSPYTSGTLTVPYTIPSSVCPDDELILDISVKQKADEGLIKAGTEIAFGQVKVPAQPNTNNDEYVDTNVSVDEKNGGYIISGEKFEVFLDGTTGILSQYKYNGELLFESGPEANFYRGLTENDGNSGRSKLFDTNWEKAEGNGKLKNISVSKNSRGETEITVDITFPDAGNTAQKMVYTVFGDGKINVSVSVDATRSGMGNFLRVGTKMVLPEGFENVSWFGNGPDETYNDRSSCGRMGIWEKTVSEFFYPYMRVDDTGNLTGVKWISVSDPSKSTALLVKSSNSFEAQALHFTPSDLNSASHVCDLSPRKETILGINYGSMGTGTATCGPGTLSQYLLSSSKVYSWNYSIIPVINKVKDVITGDINSDKNSDPLDVALMYEYLFTREIHEGTEKEKYDIDSSGNIDISDLIILKSVCSAFETCLGSTYKCDLNSDLKTDSKDLEILSDIILGKRTPDDFITFFNADINNDGTVNISDYVLIRSII